MMRNPKRHGLFARNHLSAEDQEISDLALALAAGVRSTPEVLRYAREVAVVVFHLKEIRRIRAQTAKELAEAASANTQFDNWFASFPKSQTLARLARRKKVDPNLDFSVLGPPQDQLRAWWYRLLDDYHMSPSERGMGQLAVILLDKTGTMRRLAEYERKALSRRAKAIKQLDHARIEALRRSRTHS